MGTTTLMGVQNQVMEKKTLLLESKLVSLVPVKDICDGFRKCALHDFISRIVERDSSGKVMGGISSHDFSMKITRYQLNFVL